MYCKYTFPRQWFGSFDKIYNDITDIRTRRYIVIIVLVDDVRRLLFYTKCIGHHYILLGLAIQLWGATFRSDPRHHILIIQCYIVYYEDDATIVLLLLLLIVYLTIFFFNYFFIFILHYLFRNNNNNKRVLFCSFSLYFTTCLCCAATTTKLFLPFKIFSAMRVVFFLRSSN